jgi:hypothetical protein
LNSPGCIEGYFYVKPVDTRRKRKRCSQAAALDSVHPNRSLGHGVAADRQVGLNVTRSGGEWEGVMACGPESTLKAGRSNPRAVQYRADTPAFDPTDIRVFQTRIAGGSGP